MSAGCHSDDGSGCPDELDAGQLELRRDDLDVRRVVDDGHARGIGRALLLQRGDDDEPAVDRMYDYGTIGIVRQMTRGPQGLNIIGHADTSGSKEYNVRRDKAGTLLTGIRRALTDDGVYLAQDIRGTSHHHSDAEHPLGAFLYAVSCMHCMTVSLAQGGEGLGTMWGREKAREYFEKAGFTAIEVQQLPHDVMNDYWVLRP